MNSPRYDQSILGISKKRIHFEGEDYHKAKTLATWLFIKYDMSYKSFASKRKKRKDALRAEFTADTGLSPHRTCKRDEDWDEDWYKDWE